MEDVDKDTIKALSADTRVKILKTLVRRRKMPAELSKQLKLAPSTVAEHLKQLEKANLISKKETGHKWIYYELTKKGLNLVKPSFPVHIILTLAVGLVFVVSSIFNRFQVYTTNAYKSLPDLASGTAATAEKVAPLAGGPTASINWISVTLLILGTVLIAAAIGLFWKRKKL